MSRGRYDHRLALLVLLAMTAGAHADGDPAAIDRARAAMSSSDYPAADAALREALASGTHNPAELVEIYRLSGIVSGSLGNAPAATEMFKRLLALAPAATLPPKISPRITAAFTEAQTYFKAHAPLRVKLETTDVPPAVTLIAVSDPLRMITGARVIIVADGKPAAPVQRAGTQRIELALPRASRLELRVVALDQHGNRLIELGSADVPIAVVGGKQLESQPTPATGSTVAPSSTTAAQTSIVTSVERRPLYAQPWLWGGVTVAFAATGAWFAYRTTASRDELDQILAASPSHSFSDAKAAEARLDRNALVTSIAFGAAGAAAVTTVILYLTGPSSNAEARPRATVRPLPIRGATGFTMEMPF